MYRSLLFTVADIGCSLVAEELIAVADIHLVVDIQAVVDTWPIVDNQAVVDTNDSVSVTTVYRC